MTLGHNSDHSELLLAGSDCNTAGGSGLHEITREIKVQRGYLIFTRNCPITFPEIPVNTKWHQCVTLLTRLVLTAIDLNQRNPCTQVMAVSLELKSLGAPSMLYY